MSFILSYIPWYGYETSKSDITIETNKSVITTVETDLINTENKTTVEIPNNTYNSGIILLYYSCDNSDILNFTSESFVDGDNNVNYITEMFKWAFDEHNIEKRLQIYNSKLFYLNRLISINNKLDNPYIGITYGKIIEYETSPNLNINVIKRMKHNHGSENIFRVLWSIKWEFSLVLHNNWDRELSISITDTDLIKVTKNIEKLMDYVKYISQYKNNIEKAIEFRKKYYSNLQQKKITNYLDKEFVLDMISLYKNLIVADKMLLDFRKNLNWMEDKRFDDYFKDKINTNIVLNLNITNKSTRR
jgi:hypothetical protein